MGQFFRQSSVITALGPFLCLGTLARGSSSVGDHWHRADPLSLDVFMGMGKSFCDHSMSIGYFDCISLSSAFYVCDHGHQAVSWQPPSVPVTIETEVV